MTRPRDIPTTKTTLADTDVFTGDQTSGNVFQINALNVKGYMTAGVGGGSAAYGTLVTGLTASSSGAAGANTTAIQAALTAADSAGGGRVVIPVGLYYIDNTLTIGSRCILAGLGWGSILYLADGTSTTASPKAMVSAEGNSNYIGIENLMLDGNATNQPDTNFASTGIDFFARGSTESSSAPLYDGGLYLRRVKVYNCKGYGFYLRGDATTMNVIGCEAYHNHSGGFWFKTDFEVANCVAANNGGEGFRAYSGTSARITACKGFGNGWRYEASDFLVHYCQSVMMSDCQAEDTRFRGFVFTACQFVTATNMIAYRCAPETAESSAFWVEDDTAGGVIEHFYLTGAVRAGGGAGAFAHALTTRELSSQVEIRLKTNGEFTGSKWRHISGSLSDAIVALDNSWASSSASNTQTGSYTLILADAGQTVVMNVAGANTLTIPPNASVAFPVGTVVGWEQYGAGTTTLTAGAGVTLRSRGGLLASAGQYAAGSLRKVGTNEWMVAGDLA